MSFKPLLLSSVLIAFSIVGIANKASAENLQLLMVMMVQFIKSI